ncbi:hypothetical protein MPSI1_001740 [Malassezia psittaci]|uniref:Small ribosomal subunit protein uS10m n=1 Tax=Malassezia psittaci TaxID=1821823 RepID=A0AAF0FE95_9BASI|nr:hypothetical protein MPSI1_001740 [Malassezia psittaci]
MFWASLRTGGVSQTIQRSVRRYSTEVSEPVLVSKLVSDVEPLEPTHGVHVATLQLKSYSQKTFDLDFFADFAMRCAKGMLIPTGGIAMLPTRTSLWTVPRGPFVHKKSQENFWRRTHRRSIKMFDASDATIDRFFQFLRMHEMPGVAAKVSLIRRYPIGVGQHIDSDTTMDQRSEEAVRAMAEDIMRSHMKE